MTTTGPVAKFRRMRPEDRREQILGEAYTLIARSGFNAVSLADVAKACDVQKSAVLHYFPTMTNLLMEVIAKREAQVYDQFVEREGEDSAHDAASARAQYTRVFDEQLQRPELVRLKSVLAVEALASDHPAHEYYQNFDHLAVAEMKKTLAWKPDPEVAAIELLAFWAGLDLAWHRNPKLDTTKVWNSFCDRFFA